MLKRQDTMNKLNSPGGKGQTMWQMISTIANLVVLILCTIAISGDSWDYLQEYKEISEATGGTNSCDGDGFAENLGDTLKIYTILGWVMFGVWFFVLCCLVKMIMSMAKGLAEPEVGDDQAGAMAALMAGGGTLVLCCFCCVILPLSIARFVFTILIMIVFFNIPSEDNVHGWSCQDMFKGEGLIADADPGFTQAYTAMMAIVIMFFIDLGMMCICGCCAPLVMKG